MARKHGWQLPAHTLQIVAITVFLLLVVAFYAFFAPFLGNQLLEHVAIGIYTPVVFAVFILYIRCTSINPADPGIMSKFEDGFIDAPAGTADLEGSISLPEKVSATEANSPVSSCRSSVNGRSNHAGLPAGDTNINLSSQPPQRSSKSCLLGGLICALFIKEDCRKFDGSENQVDGEDAMFCTICNAEVRKFSKHCRNCDKCVDGFDHHCRWLNNCVGRKNYFTFIALMITSLLWLAIEFGTGIAVLVICFTNKNSEMVIKGKLGNGLTRPPFATIVAFFTLLSLVACVPLGELFFFHMLLIRKGITTYEYVVAMRAMSEVPQEEEDEEEGVNIVYSRTNSATTGFSGASSLGVHHKGAWCTPPRVFVDQDEVIPHLEPGMVPSSVDPDAAAHAERGNKARKPVKISAWKLAKLDSNEAMKAAAKARASSSVLRPVGAARRGSFSDLGSSGNGSMRSSSMSVDHGATTKGKGIDRKLSSLQSSSSYPQSLVSQDEDYEESGTPSGSSMSSPVHVQNKPAIFVPRSSQISNVPPPQPPRAAQVIQQRPPVVPKISQQQIAKPPFQSATSYVRENRKASVIWDQEAGRYVSVASTRPRTGVVNPHFLASPGGGTRASSSSAAAALPSGQASERLAYTGQSIFFGGPHLGTAADPRRNDGGTRRTAESFPVFAPGTVQKNQPFNR